MVKEIERKYLVGTEQAKKLIDKAVKKVGILQWYELESNIRYRLEIQREKTGIRHKWTKTQKKDTNEIEVREELENTLDPKTIGLKDFEELPFVAKIRYFLKDDPEVILDEFLTDKHRQNIGANKYLLEIELKSSEDRKQFDITEEEFNMGKNQDITNNKAYLNKKIASPMEKENDSLFSYIEYVENYLKPKQTVITTVGITVYKIFGKDTGLISSLRSKGLEDDEIKRAMKKKDLYNLLYTTNPITYNAAKDKGLNCGEIDSIKELFELGYRIKNILYIVFPDTMKDENEELPVAYDLLKILTKKIFDLESEEITINYRTDQLRSASRTFYDVWQKLDSERKKAKDSLLIDLTGGFKYPGIMIAFYCMFNNLPFFYTYEGTKVISKFPPIPADWNYGSIDEAFAAFKNVLTGKDELPYSTYTTLPQIFRNLFTVVNKENSNQEELQSVLPLQELFKHYEEARRLPFGYGEEFLRIFGDDEEAEKRKRYITEMTATKWSLQWLGDQIPETVEHSQRHSKRLFEFATNLVNTIGEENFIQGVPKERIQDFYFILAIAFNVHDLGHTKLFYEFNGKRINLDGLPSIVRDLHNELSYQMLENNVDNLLKAPQEKIENWDKIKEAVKLVSRYHRGHMPITGKINSETKNKKKFIKIFNIDINPLEEVVKRKFKGLEDWQKATIQAARWLKFIDGTDVQADRTVDKNYRIYRVQRTAHEILNLIDLFNPKPNEKPQIYELYKCVEKISNSKYNSNSDEHELGIRAEEIGKEIESIIYSQLKAIINSTEDEVINVPERLRILDRIAFKARQFPHFEKHNLVNFVFPRFYCEKSASKSLDQTLYIRINVNDDEVKTGISLRKTLYNVKKDFIKEFENAGLSNYAIKHLKMEVAPLKEKVLITPLGTSPGVLYTLLKQANPDRVIAITSKKGEDKIEEICDKAKFEKEKITTLIFNDPFTGFDEINNIKQQFDEIQKPLDLSEIILNLAGGTSFLQYVVTELVKKLEKQNYTVTKVFAVDRRDISEQKANPYVVGEVVELP